MRAVAAILLALTLAGCAAPPAALVGWTALGVSVGGLGLIGLSDCQAHNGCKDFPIPP